MPMPGQPTTSLTPAAAAWLNSVVTAKKSNRGGAGVAFPTGSVAPAPAVAVAGAATGMVGIGAGIGAGGDNTHHSASSASSSAAVGPTWAGTGLGLQIPLPPMEEGRESQGSSAHVSSELAKLSPGKKCETVTNDQQE